ncbi:MAG: phenylpyruvate tautomerase MIF-related protein, partial [Lachnospiraceae bacterium]|nr:phenylpyruvate tautomerase MIF-related protein [Lachnospiraceae bacterium]
MPFINTKTNISLSRKQKENVKKALGEAISLIPGKSEQWLMVGFEDSCPLYFSGDTLEPCAMVEVKIYGTTTAEVYDQVTAKVTQIISEDLSIKPERIYIA